MLHNALSIHLQYSSIEFAAYVSIYVMPSRSSLQCVCVRVCVHICTRASVLFELHGVHTLTHLTTPVSQGILLYDITAPFLWVLIRLRISWGL